MPTITLPTLVQAIRDEFVKELDKGGGYTKPLMLLAHERALNNVLARIGPQVAQS